MPEKIAPAAVLFDLDGTCVDSDSLHFRSYQTVLLKSIPEINDGQPITREYYNANMSGKQNRKIMAELGAHLPEQAQNAIWKEKERLYCDYVDQGIEPLRGLTKLIERLDAAGVRRAVVTNAPRSMAEHTMAALRIRHSFGERVIIGEECERPKPEPEPYLDGLKLVGAAASRTIAFEDSPSGIASARAAGLFTFGVMSSRTEEELIVAGANVCISHYEDEKLWPLVVEKLHLDT